MANKRTSCIVDERFVPKVGMIFETLEEAAKFYKYYSKLASFSTKIRNMTRDGDKIKNQLIDVGVWTISKVVLNHSHPYCPKRAEMVKQHRELSMFVHRTIEIHEEAGIRPSKTYQSFVAAAGSHRKLGFIEKDVRNYITREAFWADARSMAAFEYFGDVVSFDTTYNTNRYNLVLGSFVGVNHHGQSTLLGCALMNNEDIQSFKWLFECWLRCMGGKAPKGILTDQCASIQRAIELGIPTTIHR
ncbi:protein FAR1-RELATED SEQUENCE 5-like [Arachis hypogaea]|uniref:protein FAR1-RELATED SEQUENCE 5-like n=1 Tax=Arachis hypogaea TaxID=3818 RepID=UPI003B2185B8